jgi:hypothetical protein
MSTSPPPAEPQQIDIRQEEFWKDPPEVSFDQMASLSIAKWVLWMFAGVYALCFVMVFMMFWSEGVDYDKATEVVKFMLQSIIPLVTLAVGYYLGDRSRQIYAERGTN